jgi:hypothetical protein
MRSIWLAGVYVAAVGLVGFVACSGKSSSTSSSSGASSGSGSSSGTTGVTAAQRCQQLATAECTHNQTCGILDPAQYNLCVNDFACSNLSLETLQDSEVDAGLLSYDANALSACVTDIQTADCSLTGAQAAKLSNHCPAIAVGTVTIGGNCELSGECIQGSNGATCQRNTSGCGGTCVSDLISGACGDGLPPPATGFFCAPDAGVVVQGGNGVSCTSDTDCALPLHCIGIFTQRTCGQAGNAGSGAPCHSDPECGPGVSCFGDESDGGPGTCLQEMGPGGSCAWVFTDGGTSSYRDGGPRPQGRLCKQGLYCDPTTITCTALSSINDPCNTDGGAPYCLLGACGSAGTCQFLADGASCTRSVDCQSGFCVNNTSGQAVCAPTCP